MTLFLNLKLNNSKWQRIEIKARKRDLLKKIKIKIKNALLFAQTILFEIRLIARKEFVLKKCSLLSTLNYLKKEEVLSQEVELVVVI